MNIFCLSFRIWVLELTFHRVGIMFNYIGRLKSSVTGRKARGSKSFIWCYDYLSEPLGVEDHVHTMTLWVGVK